jgi:glycosyltransferase involved in cell wall biosynthesis
MNVQEKSAIFYFSSIPHDFLYQRPQQLYREWRTNFSAWFDFFYVDPPHIKYFPKFLSRKLAHAVPILRLGDASQHDSHLLTAWFQFLYFPAPYYGKRVPSISENPLPRYLFQLLLRRFLGQHTSAKQKKIAIIGSPFWEPIVRNNVFDLVCYDYVDAIDVLATPASYYDARKKHEALIEKSALVFVTAEALKEDVATVAKDKDVVVVSNGVDLQFFEKHKLSRRRGLPYDKTDRKAVGYVGNIGWWFDSALLRAAAERLPHVDFIVVGPFGNRVRRFQDGPSNVRVIGPVQYEQVPAYIESLDVGLIPFKPGPITEASDPVKLYEYFALGKPVVATHLRSMERFDDGHLLRIARTPSEFAEAIEYFLAHDSKAWQASRKQVAQQNSWVSKASIIVRSISAEASKR